MLCVRRCLLWGKVTLGGLIDLPWVAWGRDDVAFLLCRADCGHDSIDRLSGVAETAFASRSLASAGHESKAEFLLSPSLTFGTFVALALHFSFLATFVAFSLAFATLVAFALSLARLAP